MAPLFSKVCLQFLKASMIPEYRRRTISHRPLQIPLRLDLESSRGEHRMILVATWHYLILKSKTQELGRSYHIKTVTVLATYYKSESSSGTVVLES